MPKTIKEILKEHGGRILTYREKNYRLRQSREQLLQDYDHADNVALAEVRQLLKECEPEIIKPESFNFSRDNAIREYTANIEKRLG